MNAIYRLLPQFNTKSSHIPFSETTPSTFPTELLSEAVFAGDSFLCLEAAFGRVDGVIKTATGYCGGTLIKPTYREVCEGRTGHTEANFCVSTHQRSAIYCSNEEERKQAQIRRQMKLNKRIVTKIMPFDSDFYMAENQHHNYYLQKHGRVCESLSLRSTLQFVESDIACKLNG
ncbi:hypothetical protein Ddye_012159 [Dipteronia dyeriana]|uniref:peptide-methionine (S)-S-oxide reductase n=1 Tax=Dipteronia dyeriana TaxID=168575 RepID=A0AAE0CJ05_9ROSI|nr:hypothetical protein Ddye_012159 [Dipteronia dyeriana]